MSTNHTEEDHQLSSALQPAHRPALHAKPRGILKNVPQPPGTVSHSLQWDEENLALTEVQKDSLMKITEPKTPYVRYNPELDEVEGDIPNLDLDGPGSPLRGRASPIQSVSSTGADTSGPSSRRTSISSMKSGSGRSGSANSSRSTSFNLPSEARGEIRADKPETGEEIEIEEELDEEAAAKHAAFVRARGRHYSNEAEAMKRAVALMADDDEDDDLVERARQLPQPNGIGHEDVA